MLRDKEVRNPAEFAQFRGLVLYFPHVTNNPTVAAAITPVATQPSNRSVLETREKGPITRLLPAMCIRTNITGTETTPLMRADQTSALIGSSFVQLIASTTTVATISTP